MTELATMNLFQPLLVSFDPVEFGGNISRYCWPTYKRETRALGGDWQATFQFSAHDSILERWFDNYLACHFEESYGGLLTFSGLIWSMRLAYNGVVLFKSFGDIINAVQVRYMTNSASSKFTTAQVTDDLSIAIYGTQRLVEEPRVYIDSTTAQAYRDNLLDKFAWPRSKQEAINLAGSQQPGTLQVEVRGYKHTLNSKLENNTSTSLVNLSDEISGVLASADYVLTGSIAANTLQVAEEVDYVPAGDRIDELVDIGSSGGSRWLAGCFQGRTFTYSQADPTNIGYEQELTTQRKLTYEVGSNNIIPAPYIQPGKVLFVRDIMGGRPVAATILDDPRAIFVESVEYSKDGAILKGQPSTDAQKAAALSIAIKQQIRRLAGQRSPGVLVGNQAAVDPHDLFS